MHSRHKIYLLHRKLLLNPPQQSIDLQVDFVVRLQQTMLHPAQICQQILHHVLFLLCQPRVCSRSSARISMTWARMQAQGCCGIGPATLVMTNFWEPGRLGSCCLELVYPSLTAMMLFLAGKASVFGMFGGSRAAVWS